MSAATLKIGTAGLDVGKTNQTLRSRMNGKH